MRGQLALETLKPGDIILTASPTWSSMSIRIASGSIYSHASLVIDPLIWFEAVDEGVQYRIVDAGIGVIEGKLHYLHSLATYKRLAVYRHPQLAELSIEELEWFGQQLMAESKKFFLLAYPPADAFLPILKANLGYTKIAKYVSRLFTDKHSIMESFPELSKYYGPFCSSLVVNCLREVDLQAVGIQGALMANLDPSAITPGALSRRRAGLQRIDSGLLAGNGDTQLRYSILSGLLREHADNWRMLISSAQRHIEILRIKYGTELLARELSKVTKEVAKEENIEGSREIESSNDSHASSTDLELQADMEEINKIDWMAWQATALWAAFRAARECSLECAESKSFPCKDDCSRSARSYLGVWDQLMPQDYRQAMADAIGGALTGKGTFVGNPGGDKES
jgi:hypothetical protein